MVDTNKYLFISGVAGAPRRRALAAAMAVLLAFALVCSGSLAPLCAFAAPTDGMTAGVIVAGVDDEAADEPMAETWVPLTDVTFDEGATAWELFQPLLDEAGITYDAQDSEYGVYVQSITRDGHLLENTDSEPYSFWAFLVNGEMAMEGVGSYQVQDGDQIQLAYYPGGEAPAQDPMPISAEAPEAPADSSTSPAESDLGTKLGAAAFIVAAVVLIAAAVHLMKKRKGE